MDVETVTKNSIVYLERNVRNAGSNDTESFTNYESERGSNGRLNLRLPVEVLSLVPGLNRRLGGTSY